MRHDYAGTTSELTKKNLLTDAFIRDLPTKTATQIENWVDANCTDQTTTNQMLKRLYKMMAVILTKYPI